MIADKCLEDIVTWLGFSGFAQTGQYIDALQREKHGIFERATY